MRLLVFLLLSFTAVFPAFSQDKLTVDVLTKDFKTDKKDGGVTVKVYDGATLVSTHTSSASGKVVFEVPLGKVYKVEASKAGKVTRFINVNAKGISPELLPANAAPTATFSIGLFEQQPNVDYSYVTSNPTTEFYFDGKDPALVYDDIIAKKMAAKIEKLLKDADAAKGQNDAQYNQLIKTADGLFTQKKYQEALTSYEQALGLKPTEAYPAQKINEIDGILKAEKASAQQNAAAQQEYDGLIAAADNLFKQGKFEEAKGRYNEALTKKQEQYPKDQVVKCDAEIARLKKEAENAQKYTDAIKAADAFYTQKSYQAARDKYKEALKWKANDPHATTRLADIEGKLNAQQAEQDKMKKYEEANNAGDALFAAEKWTEAKAKYSEALAIMPSSTYTQGKIKEIDAKLAEAAAAKAKEEQIQKLLAEGNTAFTASQWVPSKTKYQEVLKLDAENAAAKARIEEIDKKIAFEKENADKLAKIKQLITEGDALAKQTKLPEAKAKYAEALALNPDPAVQAKIDAIDKQIAEAAGKAEQKAKYDKAMADGEALFTAANYEGAKAKFQEALTIDAAQALPKTRIADADKKIAEALAGAQKAEKYAAALAAGTTAQSSGDLAGAKAKYQEAIAIDGTKPEAKTRLAEVDKLLADKAAADANHAKYEAAVKAGNDLLAAGKPAEAKAKFTEALAIEPNQTLPKEKIAEIDKQLANAAQQQQIAALIKEGDAALAKKDAPAARAKYEQVLAVEAGNAVASAKLLEVAKLENELAGAAEKEAKFKNLKDEATALYGQGKYNESKQKAIEAKAIKSDAAIEQLIKDNDAKLAEIAKAAGQEKAYNDLIAEAQGLEGAKDYDGAIAKYNEALKVKNEQLPKDRIAAINKIREGNANQAKYDAAVASGTELLAANKLAEAKVKFQEAQAIDPAQSLPKQKISEIDNMLAGAEKQKQIDALIKEGDAALGKKDLGAAKGKFQQVLALEASNATATAKLADIAAQEAAMAGQAQNEARFRQLKDEGVALMGQNKYAEAKAKFTETKSIKSDAGIDKLIADCEAKIAELASNADKDRQYADLLAAAQALEGSKQYDAAITKYNEALKVKNEQLPKDRIAAINKIKSDAADQAKADADYAAAMKKGDDAMAGKQYLDAIKFYNSALAIKPTEKEPVTKAAEAERLSKESGDDFAIQYQKVLDVAQKSMDEKNYTKAKELYNRAITLKSDDPFPKQKLAEIDALLKAEEDGKKKLASYNAKIAEAEASAKAGNLQGAIDQFGQAKTIKPDEVLPDNRIAELRAQLDGKNAAAQETERRYQELMTAGNAAETGKNFSGALTSYQEALNVKPKDKVAQDKIAEMKQVLDNEAKKNQQNAEVAKLMAKADAEFDGKKWMSAKDAYDRVLSVDPGNARAQARLKESLAMAQKEKDNEVNEQYMKVIAKADGNFDKKDYDNAKSYYKRALNLKPSDSYPKQRLAQIEAILNPKAPVTQKEPEPLESLGTETDNSIVETENRLQQAEQKRRGNRFSKFRRIQDKSTDANDSLTALQNSDATQTSVTMAQIVRENSEAAVTSDEKQQGNAHSLADIDTEIKNNAIRSGQYETAENLDAKAQIETANRIAAEQSSLMDGHAAENGEILKASKTELENGAGDIDRSAYGARLDNQKDYMGIRIEIEQQDRDDIQSRIETEQIVRNATKSVVEVNQQNQIRTNASLDAVNAKMEDYNTEVSYKYYEDTKRSSVNEEELKRINIANNELREIDEEEHLENTLAFRNYVEAVEGANSEAAGQRDVSHSENANAIQGITFAQEESERNSYNAALVKSLNTNGTIRTEVIKQDQYAVQQSTAGAENTEKIKRINDDKQAREAVATAQQTEKHQGTQASLNSTTQKVEANSIVGSERAHDNQQVLKATQSDLGAAEGTQNAQQEKKTQAAKQLLASLEKKEIVYSDKVANDLGKLYPEGVSQEQFEQYDEEGLLKAVVTRRVVVTNGYGAIYVRIQTLSGLTYSKNDQPTTEYVWQRETQDAKLKRNY